MPNVMTHTRSRPGAWACAFLVGLSLGTSASAGEPSLESRLMPLVRAHKGEVALAVKNLKTGETFLHRQDEPMPTASLIKFPVMVEAYRQAAEKAIDLDEAVTLEASDKVPGSGILTDHFSAGATFPLRDAVHLMIAFSDNTATNLVLDEIGIGSTAATMERMGYPHTKIHSKVFRRDTSVCPRAEQAVRPRQHHRRRDDPALRGAPPEGTGQRGGQRGDARPHACLRRQGQIPAVPPPGTKIAFKTGSVDESRTAAGIIETATGPVALCVLTHHNEDRRYHPDNARQPPRADVAKAVFDHFQPGCARCRTRRK